MAGYFEDASGNKSSKRLIGSILVANAIILKNAEWTISIFKQVANIAAMTSASDSMLYSGITLLGIGIGEHLFKNKNEKTQINNNPAL